MPTTAHGAPYPSPLDARDVPGDVQALAEWVDAHGVHIAASQSDRDARFADLPAGQRVATSAAPWMVWLKTGAGNSWVTLYSDTGRVTAGFQPGDGWSFDFSEARNLNGLIEIRVSLTRTGADIVAQSDGNIPDVLLMYVPPQFAPASQRFAIATYKASATDGSLMGMSGGGPVYLTTMNPGSTIANGNYVRATYQYMAG